jgi:hypothetical protein
MRFDYLFSYWILFWVILYLLKIVNYSPKFAIIIGIIEISIGGIYYIYMNISKYQLIKYITINTIMKIIPLLIVINDKITNNDIIVSIIYFIIYLVWLFINNQNVFDIYKKINDEYIYDLGKNKTFMNKLFDKIFKK